MDKDILKSSVRVVLNELTPQTFETLLSRLKGFNIDTEEKLALIVDLIYEEAVYEPNSTTLANLCKHLCLIKVPVSGTSGTHVNFRKLLLTKCQKEFEQGRIDELKKEEKMKPLEAADPDKREELQPENELIWRKIFRNRQLGNIRFMGEIFKLGMLIEPIMHECIKKLLIQGDELSLECVCQLLKTIGKELDDTKATKNSRDNQTDVYMAQMKLIYDKYLTSSCPRITLQDIIDQQKMDVYMAQMKLIVDKRLTSSRLRIMLQDVIDLQKNNWVPNENRMVESSK